MVGDPSGRSLERPLLEPETVQSNVSSLRQQLGRFLTFDGRNAARIVNNMDWLSEVRLLDFLRSTGFHFPVQQMLARDSVHGRLHSGLSYTEFSYMTLQAYDFAHLHREHGVELQTGGADQWGNITAGLELLRRTRPLEGRASSAHGMTYTLLLDANGEKFGKTAAGTSVWLDPDRTTPADFYSYWLARPPSEVGRLLRVFTLRPRAEILDLERDAAKGRSLVALRALSWDVTARVHGVTEARRAERQSSVHANLPHDSRRAPGLS
jgi:tyrosyl-tRNA synthetase